jgi:hypothetical protein
METTETLIQDSITAERVHSFKKEFINNPVGEDLAASFIQAFELQIMKKDETTGEITGDIKSWKPKDVFDALFEKNVTLRSMIEVMNTHWKYGVFLRKFTH